jgi:hypothetical protein
MQHDSYGEIVDIMSDKKPWRNKTKQNAKRLAHLADLCRRERRNEASWRMALEPEVFARLAIEIAW